MAAGVRAEEPLAELSHYVVARPIYNEAGFQEENERLPPPPPTLLERARAVCRWVGGGGGRAPPRGREPWEPRGARRDRHGTARRCRCPPARLGFSSRQSVWAQSHTRRFPKVMEFGAPTGASSWEKPPLALKACTTPLFFSVSFSQGFLSCFLSEKLSWLFSVTASVATFCRDFLGRFMSKIYWLLSVRT